MKRIALGALAGWSSIVGLGWWFADQRIALCMDISSDTEVSRTGCIVRATAARDAMLTNGLAVALAVAVVLALLSGGRAALPIMHRNRVGPPADRRMPMRLPRLLQLFGPAQRGPGFRSLGIAGLLAAIFALGWLSHALVVAQGDEAAVPSVADPDYVAASQAAPGAAMEAAADAEAVAADAASDVAAGDNGEGVEAEE